MDLHQLRRTASRPTAGKRGTRLRRRVGRVVAIVAIVAVTSTASIIGQAAQPAYAVDYPSWGDVIAAKANEQAKQAEIGRLQSLLAQLAQQVADAQALEVQRGTEYQVAQQKFDEANYKAEQLQAQADAQKIIADESKLKAGQLAARLAKAGGDDISASLFFDSGSADDLLSQLGMSSKISDSSAGIYGKAVRDRNTAQALTDQANVAKKALKALADAAQAALQAAIAASQAARDAVAEQEANKVVLDAQLAVLTQNRAATEADYNAGVAYRAEQARLAEIERQKALAASGSRPAGVISASGWTRPASGPLSSGFGYRIHPIYHTRIFHAGTDIAAGCGQPIFAAAAGTVTYSGWNGGYGNYISINHGGVSTAYGHIVNGGLLVGVGAQVKEGQQIARVGTTGGSTGCHLHFEVRVGGSLVNPVDFMRGQGAPL